MSLNPELRIQLCCHPPVARHDYQIPRRLVPYLHSRLNLCMYPPRQKTTRTRHPTRLMPVYESRHKSCDFPLSVHQTTGLSVIRPLSSLHFPFLDWATARRESTKTPHARHWQEDV